MPKDVNENRAAVVICPGGAYAWLAYTPEGLHPAEALNRLGMVAAILKYRLPDDRIMTERHKRPLQDAQRALQIMHEKADAYHVDPNRIGIMGFSAGGHLAATVSTHFNEVLVPGASADQVKPDFSILIYPVISLKAGLTHQGSRDNLTGVDASQEQARAYSNELQVRAHMAPVFLLHAADDTTVKVQNSLVFFEALHQKNIPVEMHIMDKGGHGFGLRPDTPTNRWFVFLESFLKSQHIL
jgi:acetyl esterase/lipase